MGDPKFDAIRTSLRQGWRHSAKDQIDAAEAAYLKLEGYKEDAEAFVKTIDKLAERIKELEFEIEYEKGITFKVQP